MSGLQMCFVKWKLKPVDGAVAGVWTQMTGNYKQATNVSWPRSNLGGKSKRKIAKINCFRSNDREFLEKLFSSLGMARFSAVPAFEEINTFHALFEKICGCVRAAFVSSKDVLCDFVITSCESRGEIRVFKILGKRSWKCLWLTPE